MFPATRLPLAVAPSLALLILMLPAVAPAQTSSSGAISTFLDPSIPSSGMGRTGVAVFWQEDLNDWSNPALLGYQRGIRYSHGETQLVPELAEDVRFTSDRFAVGAWGVGVSMAGKPIDDLGKLELDYGVSEATDEDGNVVGTFHSVEEIRQVGVGVNVIQFLENVVRATGGGRSYLSRYADISIGHAWKSVVVDLAPVDITLPNNPARGKAKQKDRGALIRITPIDAAAEDGAWRIRLDGSGGFSQRNYDEVTIAVVDPDESDPIVEERLVGAAARATVTFDVPRGGIWHFLSPSVSAAAAWEEARYYWDGDRLDGERIRRTGQEIALLGLGSLRHGFVDDPTGDIRNDTWGFSVGLQYRGVVGARYDWAEVPQASFLGKVHREGFTVWFDPFRLARATAGHGGGIAQR